MAMLHWEPFRAMRDLDRLSNQLLSGTRTPLNMPMDAWREGQTYRIALDIPGVAPQDIDVQVERNTLTITARRTADFAAPEKDAGGGPTGADAEVLVAERPQGNFTRQLTLGEGLDASRVVAEHRHGVLHLTIPVREQSEARRIPVGSTAGGPAVDPVQLTQVGDGPPPAGDEAWTDAK